jgi:glycerol-3-phosphate acyltransferase PlsY
MMAPMWPVVVAAPFAWALGTFPTAVLVARARGVDITAVGSGNPGASNVLRAVGTKAFALVMAVDFLKGAIAAAVGLALGDRPGAYVLGAMAVLGHTFPLYRKGGKGVAAAGGMVFVLFPLITIALAVVWAVLGRVLRKASLASIVVTIAYPILVWLTGHDGWEIAVTSAIAVLLIARHWTNIRRLVRGEEGDLRAHAGAREPL